MLKFNPLRLELARYSVYNFVVRRLCLLFLLLLITLSPRALAEESKSLKLKDVPDDHWAAAAVYDLIKMGVTRGYPDGTYRGNKPITRYETAIFLSKLAKAIGSENNADIKALRDQLIDIKKNSEQRTPITGSYLGNWKAGNLLASKGALRGAVGSYRLMISATHEVSDSSSIKIDLDTMDYGYFDDSTNSLPGRGNLASEFLDVESRFKVSLAELPLDLKVTYGRGPKVHAADPTGVLPSEAGVIYVRPNTGVSASTNISQADMSLGYYALQGATLNTSGKVTVSQLTGSVAFNLPSVLTPIRLALTGDYITQGLINSTARDMRAKFNFSLPLGEKVQASTTVGMADKTQNGMMVSGALSLNDIWDTGTFATLNVAKIGSAYINPFFAEEEFYFAGLDNFSRALIPGTVQMGGVLTQVVSDRVKLVGKGDMRLASNYKYEGANARLTAEGGISYNIAPNANLDAAYRVHQDKGTGDTSDMAAVGLMYRF
jgi:hypothetical protein